MPSPKAGPSRNRHIFAADAVRTERYCLTFRDTVTVPSEAILASGRHGLWTQEAVIFNRHRVRLGFHLFNPHRWQADYTFPRDIRDRKETLYVCCDIQGMQSLPFTAMLCISLPSHPNRPDILHRWNVSDDVRSRRTPSIPVGVLESCYHDPAKRAVNPTNEVRMNVELAFFFQKNIAMADSLMVSTIVPMAKRSETVDQYRFELDNKDIAPDVVDVNKFLLARACPGMDLMFARHLEQSTFVSNYRNEIRVLLRYVKCDIVPRSSEITDKLITLAIQYKMTDLLFVLGQTLYPIHMRNTLIGFVRIFEGLDILKSVWMNACMFDALRFNGTVQHPGSIATMALGVLPRDIPGVYDPARGRFTQSAIEFGLLNGPILLGDSILSYILRTTEPPDVPAPESPVGEAELAFRRRMNVTPRCPDGRPTVPAEVPYERLQAPSAEDPAPARAFIPYVTGPVPTNRDLSGLYVRRGFSDASDD